MMLKKKLVSVLLATAMVLGLGAPAFAAEDETATLERLADMYITVSHVEEETIYSNLQEFFSAARDELPEFAELDLARFAMEYTHQSYDTLPDEMMLDILGCSEASTSCQILHVGRDGTVEQLTEEETEILLSDPISLYADWTSDDGYLKIKTDKVKDEENMGPNGTPYILTAQATWLKFPTWRFTDTFGIVYDGAFDDSYPILSTLTEEGKCSLCGKTFKWLESEAYGPSADNPTPHPREQSDLIELDFSRTHAISAKIDLQMPTCYHPAPDDPMGTLVTFAVTTKIQTLLRFKVLVSSTGEARAAYAHSHLSWKIPDIDFSYSDGKIVPSFSGTPFVDHTPYSAAPITLPLN